MEFTYKGRDFYLNGEKFVIRCGAMHYFRTPKYYWYDRLLKLKECGFNAVETYVAWNIHEPKEGTYHFDGERVCVQEQGREHEPIRFSTTDKKKKLRIFVENMGRANYGPNLLDRKGISGVRLCWEYMNKNLMNFENISLPLDNLGGIIYNDISVKPINEPAFYKGEFYVDEISDTFFKPYGLAKVSSVSTA